MALFGCLAKPLERHFGVGIDATTSIQQSSDLKLGLGIPVPGLCHEQVKCCPIVLGRQCFMGLSSICGDSASPENAREEHQAATPLPPRMPAKNINK